MNHTKSTEFLRIQWLESTLEFTREKINLEDVLASLMNHLAETTVSSKASEQKLNRIIVKSDMLLHAMRMEVLACKEVKEKLVALNSMLVSTLTTTTAAAVGEENRKLTC